MFYVISFLLYNMNFFERMLVKKENKLITKIF